MIVEYTRYEIDEKRRALFERVYEKAGEALRSSIHCLRYELSHCTEDPDHYTLRIEWDSEEGHLEGVSEQSRIQDLLCISPALGKGH